MSTIATNWQQSLPQQQQQQVMRPCFQPHQQGYYMPMPPPPQAARPPFHLPPPPPPPPPPPTPPCGELFIGNLPPSVTKVELSKELAKFGQLEHLSLAYGPGGVFRGFAFARFCRPESAFGLVDGRGPGVTIDGRPLRIEWRRGGGFGFGDAQSGCAVSTVSTAPIVNSTMKHRSTGDVGEHPTTNSSSNNYAVSKFSAPAAGCCPHKQQQQQQNADLELPQWLHARLVEDTERLVDCLLAELRLCNRLAASTNNKNEAAGLRNQARDLEVRLREKTAELSNLTGAGGYCSQCSRIATEPATATC